MRNVVILLLLIALGVSAGNLPVQAQHDTSTDDAVEHFNKGNALYGEGKYDEAIEQFKKALDHNPKDASSHFGLGNSYFLKKDYKTALGHYKQVVELKPDYAKVHYAMGLAYRRLGLKDEAQKEFEQYNSLSKRGETRLRTAEKPAKEERPKVARVEKKPSEPKKPPTKEESAESRQLETRAWDKKPEDRQLESEAWVKKPEDRKLESRKWADEGSRTSRTTRKAEIKKKPLVRKIEPKEEVTKRPTKRVKKEGAEIRGKRDILGSLWNSSPLGKIFLGLIAYTLVAQVWLGLVILVCLIFLWKKR